MGARQNGQVYKYAKHLYGRYISGIAADMRADSHRGLRHRFHITTTRGSRMEAIYFRRS